jgi:hypothetical protein
MTILKINILNINKLLIMKLVNWIIVKRLRALWGNLFAVYAYSGLMTKYHH